MILDMNDPSLQSAGAFVFPDYPFTPPPASQVREQVIIRGSSSAGTSTYGRGTPDAAERPRPYYP